jgi:hypothetical protein
MARVVPGMTIAGDLNGGGIGGWGEERKDGRHCGWRIGGDKEAVKPEQTRWALAGVDVSA